MMSPRLAHQLVFEFRDSPMQGFVLLADGQDRRWRNNHIESPFGEQMMTIGSNNAENASRPSDHDEGVYPLRHCQLDSSHGSLPFCEPPLNSAAEIYCERHGCRKTYVLWKKCQERGKYWDAWEEGRGPGQHSRITSDADSELKKQGGPSHYNLFSVRGRKDKKLLGDRVSQALSLVGITEERVSSWLGRPCGCSGRKQKLNQLDAWARRITSENVQKAKWFLEDMMRPPITWSYGITTVPSRFDHLLPQTLRSLEAAGFDKPHLFIDGPIEERIVAPLQLPYTIHSKPMLPVGNFMTGLWGIYVADPRAAYYAMFQDDILAVHNLRQFLERSEYPKRGYLNLYTDRTNQQLIRSQRGWHLSNQLCKGALALVFDRDTLVDLLSNHHMALKPQDSTHNRSWKNLDGGVSESMRNAGYKEYVHNPSLVQHAGTVSTIGNNDPRTGKSHYPISSSFPGEAYDALNFLTDRNSQ